MSDMGEVELQKENYMRETIAIGRDLILRDEPLVMTQAFTRAMEEIQDVEDACYIMGYFERMRRHFTALPHHQRLKTAQEMIASSQAEAMAQPDAPKVSCKKGCSHCCYQRVTTTFLEAEAIAEKIGELTPEQRIDATLQMAWTADDYGKNWPHGRCMFLERDGSCGIYEDRPLICRTVMAVTPPEYCKTRSKKTVGFFLSMQTEAIINASWNVPGAGINSLAGHLCPGE